MKDNVLKESYVERFAREQKEKMGTPAESKVGIPSAEKMGIPVTESIPDNSGKNTLDENVTESNVTEGKKQKEGKKHGTNARSEGHEAQTE